MAARQLRRLRPLLGHLRQSADDAGESLHLGAAYGLVHMSGEGNASFFAEELVQGKRFANALSEPTSGNLFLMPLQSAIPVAGGYVLDGAKRFVSGCETADYLLVNALVDGTPAFFGITPDATLKLIPIWTAWACARLAAS